MIRFFLTSFYFACSDCGSFDNTELWDPKCYQAQNVTCTFAICYFFVGGHIFTCFFLSLSLTFNLCCFICSHLLSFSRLFSMHVLFILEGKENNNKKNREDRLLFQLFEGQAHFLIKPKWKLSHCPETQEIKETQIVCFRFFEVFLPFFLRKPAGGSGWSAYCEHSESTGGLESSGFRITHQIRN